MYELFEHTADVGLRVRSPTLNQLFADAARGLFCLLVANPDGVRPVQQIALELSDDQCDYLLFDWLSELLYAFDTRRLLLCDFDVDVRDGSLSATCRGEPLDLQRHQMDHEVKAITYHHLKVVRDNDGWLAEVIVDI